MDDATNINIGSIIKFKQESGLYRVISISHNIIKRMYNITKGVEMTGLWSPNRFELIKTKDPRPWWL